MLEGNKRPSKIRPIQCSVCGGYFASLGEVNRHYKLAGHQRKRHPAKKFRLDATQYSVEQVEQAIAFLELLKNPRELRARFREYIDKQQYKRDRERYGRR